MISGIYSSPRRYSFVYADGTVLGKVERCMEIEIPYLQHVKTHKNPKISEISINFFGFFKKILKIVLTNEKSFDILIKLSREWRRKHGGIAQLARAIGSYPIGRGFKSNFRYH